MRKYVLMTTMLLLLASTVALSLPLAVAGWNNQNDANGKSLERGTGKKNNLNGCRPDIQSGDYWVYIPSDLPPGWSHEWEGGPCCPSNTLSGIESNYPLPNQCCNPPDDSGAYGVPGNHCLCFQLREYPIPNALP